MSSAKDALKLLKEGMPSMPESEESKKKKKEEEDENFLVAAPVPMT